jgi:phage regulator Rha-like protein
VAATLKNGRHDNVLRYIERLTADDPRALPPLDGPLLDEV